MDWKVLIVIVGIGVYVYYWCKRPIHWQDGEGPLGLHHSLFETDICSFRWWFINYTEPGQVIGHSLDIRDWYENERRRWRPVPARKSVRR